MLYLKDAFIACASQLASTQDLRQAANNDNVGYTKAAAAIASLRISRICCDEDLSAILILGVAIVTFALHHSDCLTVCRAVLSLLQSAFMYDQTLPRRLDHNDMAFLLCLIGTETDECVLDC